MIELFWILIFIALIYSILPDSWKQKSGSKSHKKPRTKWGEKVVYHTYNLPLPRNLHPAIRQMAKAAGIKPGEWLEQQLNATSTLKRLVQPKGGSGRKQQKGEEHYEKDNFDM